MRVRNRRNLQVNVGSGAEIKISRLAELVKEVVGFRGSLEFDVTRPDGPRRKYLDCSNMNYFGWSPSVNIEDGLDQTYRWFQKILLGRILKRLKGSKFKDVRRILLIWLPINLYSYLSWLEFEDRKAQLNQLLTGDHENYRYIKICSGAGLRIKPSLV